MQGSDFNLEATEEHKRISFKQGYAVMAEYLRKASKHLKVVRDSYRKSLIQNLKYKHPPFISMREWNEFILDAKVKGDGQRKITPKNVRRYAIVLTTSTLM